MIDLDADLDAMLDPEHFGVPVTFTGAPAGLHGRETWLDQVTAVGDDGYGGVVGRQRVVVLKSSAATLLSQGMALTVNGVSREVLNPRAIEDGMLTTVAIR